MLAIPPSHIDWIWFLSGLCLFVRAWFCCWFVRGVHTEHPLELSQHETEHASRNAQRGTEHDTDVPHRHLIDVRILDDKNEMRSECPEKAIVRDRQSRNEL